MQRAAPKVQENLNDDFSVLPDEMVVNIIHQLPPSDLASLGTTNHYFAALVKEELDHRLKCHDHATIIRRITFFRQQKNLLHEDIEDHLPSKDPHCHPAENACLSTCVSIGLLAFSFYTRDRLPVAISLGAVGIIGILASILFIIKHCRADITVRHDYRRIDAINDIETGLIETLRQPTYNAL